MKVIAVVRDVGWFELDNCIGLLYARIAYTVYRCHVLEVDVGTQSEA